MTTVNKNLSEYDLNLVPSANGMKIGIVVEAEWNPQITQGLLKGAIETLEKCGCKKIEIHNGYQKFELSLGAQFLEYSKIDAVICLGSVVQGETKHFDFVCEGTALGIKDVSPSIINL